MSKNAVAAYSGGSNNPWADTADDMGVVSGQFMKFNSNNGDYTFGSEGEEIPSGTRLIVDMNSLARGFICWVEEEVVDEVLVRAIDGKPPGEDELTDHAPEGGYKKYEDGTEDGWAAQVKIVFRGMETGEDYTFKTTSKSGMRAIGALSQSYGRVFRQHEGEMPIVELSTSSFIPKNNKKVGKKYAPVFKIVDWISEDEAAALADGGGADSEDNYKEPEKVEKAEVAPEKAAAAPEKPEAPREEPNTDAPPAGQGRRTKRF
jgi:hypothetical protein